MRFKPENEAEMSELLIDMKTFGFDETIKMFADAANAVLSAREYALASTGKMVRDHVKEFGKRIRPMRNPFTGLLRSYTNGTLKADDSLSEILRTEGSKKEAFHFGANMVARFRAGKFGNKTIKDLASTLSRVRAREVKRQAKIAQRGWARKSKYNPSYRDGQGGYKKLNKRGRDDIPPFQKLVQLVKFHLDSVAGKVTVGLYPGGTGTGQTDPVLDQKVAKNAAGFTINITNRMRRFFFAIGFPTDASTLTVPARPWFEPAYNQIKGRIKEHFNGKFIGRIMPFLRSGRRMMPEAA